jgi:hypothetical protein
MLTDTADKLKVVTNGAIILNSAVLLIDHDDAKVWSVEAKSKYAQLAGCTDGYNPTVWFAKTEESLNLDEDALDTVTVLELDLPDDGEGGWTVTATGGRYEWNIIAYRVLHAN